MNQQIAHISLIVADYDEAIFFYTQKLHFDLIEDTYIPEQDKHWVLIRPAGSKGAAILLAKASNEIQTKAIGNQCGGRVFLFLYTDDFERDFQNLLNHDIKIIRPPAIYSYGQVAVFSDLYGNLWDLIQPSKSQIQLLNDK